MSSLAVLATHPIQYHAPVYRAFAKELGEKNFKVFFGCSQGLEVFQDLGFGVSFKWDINITDGYPYELLSDKGLNVLSSWESPCISWKALQAIRRFNPDFILVMNYTPFFILFATWLLVLTFKPLLLRADTGDFPNFPEFRPYPWKVARNLVLKFHYLLFHSIFPIGSKSYEHYLHHGVPPSKMKTVLFSADSDFIQQQVDQWLPHRATLRSKFGIPEDHFVLLFSGKMYDGKKPLLIPQALSLLPEETLKKIWLIGLGDGALRKSFEQESQKVLGERVIFTGFKNQKEMGAYFAVADTLILPSSPGEIWGIVVNEALAYHLRVIISDRVGAGFDLLNNLPQGFVFPADSVSELAECIKKAMATPTPQVTPPLPSSKDLANSILERIRS